MDTTTWQQRADALWALFDSYEPDAFVTEMTRLVSERPADDALGASELGGAYDSTGHSDLAVPHYRRALELGLDGNRHRQVVIQLASSLRNLGQASESVALLEGERDARSDELDDAVRAFLSLALIDVGREHEAAAIALQALAPHLPRYQRSVKNYAGAADEVGGPAAAEKEEKPAFGQQILLQTALVNEKVLDLGALMRRPPAPAVTRRPSACCGGTAPGRRPARCSSPGRRAS